LVKPSISWSTPMPWNNAVRGRTYQFVLSEE
jgi:hypothetical protein